MRWSVALLVIPATLAACRNGPPAADLVLRHGAVYTVDSAQPRAQAVAVHGGKIVFVGADSAAQAWIGPRTRVLDAGGRMVLPGFHDTHVHPVTSGLELAQCDLNDVGTRDALVAAVAACARRDTSGWLLGGGWLLPLFPDGRAPKALLDSLAPGRPAFLTSADAHTAWVSSAALALAGVGRSTPDPPQGRIVRDARGEPSGTLREAAMALVSAHIPPPTDAEYLDALRRAEARAVRFGITSWQDANASEEVARAWHVADSLGELRVRTIVSLHVDPDSGLSQVARLAALRQRYDGRLEHPVAAKIFLDGVIEGQTAALLAPYTDRPGWRGELNYPPGRLDSLVHALDSAGFKVHVHAIGDLAIRTALDAFAAQHARDGGAGPRHVIAHLQLWDPADIPRPAALGVVMSFQPLWAYRDSYMRNLTEPRLGPARSQHQYLIHSLVASGAIVAAGSDWSVTSLNPLDAIEVAVTRREPGDSTGAPFIPSERVDLATAIRMYTLNGAYADDAEATNGSLVVGKDADLIVLSDNLFEVPPHRIHTVRVLLTLMGGRETWRDSTAYPNAR